MLGGHEGAGVVEEVGPGVRSVRPGDRVAFSFIPACGSCRWCVSGMTYLCDNGAMMFDKGMVTDGTARRHLGDEDLTAMTQLGTFAEYAVLAEESVIKIDDSIPFEAASLVSCGVTTGWGSATVGVGTQPGDTVVIIGTGGVGINAVQGARAAGARAVIAVDPVEFKRDSAKFFGATETVASARRGHSVGAGTDGRGDGRPGGAHAECAARRTACAGDDADPQGRHLPDDRDSEDRREHRATAAHRLHSVLQDAQRAALRRHEPTGQHADAVVDVPQRQPQTRRTGHSPIPARSDQRRDHRHARRTEHPRHHRIRAKGQLGRSSPADSAYRPTGRRRDPIPARSRTPTGR